jgi:hypothetical protein
MEERIYDSRDRKCLQLPQMSHCLNLFMFHSVSLTPNITRLNYAERTSRIRGLLICGFLWVLSVLNFFAFSAHSRGISSFLLPYTLFLGSLSFTLLNVFCT